MGGYDVLFSVDEFEGAGGCDCGIGEGGCFAHDFAISWAVTVDEVFGCGMYL